jgi:hypothetical protein
VNVGPGFTDCDLDMLRLGRGGHGLRGGMDDPQ